MTLWLRRLDGLLRGGLGLRSADQLGARERRVDPSESGGAAVSLRFLVSAAIVLGSVYGFFMGWFSLGGSGKGQTWQLLSGVIKLPALFLLTLGVSFPSLYVFNALVGCRLKFEEALRVLMAAVVIHLAVGASLGPILGFFTLSTTSYPFMVLLNVALLGLSGLIGLGFLLRTLREVAERSVRAEFPRGEVDDRAQVGDMEAREEVGRRELAVLERLRGANAVFRIWVVIYGLVGVQMGWILRPFIAQPDADFAVFRARDGNFFSSIAGVIERLVGS